MVYLIQIDWSIDNIGHDQDYEPLGRVKLGHMFMTL